MEQSFLDSDGMNSINEILKLHPNGKILLKEIKITYLEASIGELLPIVKNLINQGYMNFNKLKAEGYTLEELLNIAHQRSGDELERIVHDKISNFINNGN